MASQFQTDDKACRSLEPLLSGYTDNLLSAREVWEVEKHLALCADCSRLAQEMQATVRMLHSAERYDTADGFMAKLHARLDMAEPEPARGAALRSAVQDWLGSLRTSLRSWHAPALTIGLAAAALILFVRITPPAVSVVPPGPSVERAVDLSRQVAFTASNPFDDPVAAKAEVDSSVGTANDGHSDPSGVPTTF